MAVEAKLIDKIGGRAKSDVAALQGIEDLPTDVELRAGQKVRHLLANVVLPAKPRRRACVQNAAAHAGGKSRAVEISLGHLLKALAADHGADFLRVASGLDVRQFHLVRPARTGDAALRHAEPGR